MDETGWTRVAKESDLAEKALVVVAMGEEKILLVRLQGKVYAVGHECPHYQEKLENGALFGTQIVCKSHFARMDVTTGQGHRPARVQRSARLPGEGGEAGRSGSDPS